MYVKASLFRVLYFTVHGEYVQIMQINTELNVVHNVLVSYHLTIHTQKNPLRISLFNEH